MIVENYCNGNVCLTTMLGSDSNWSSSKRNDSKNLFSFLCFVWSVLTIKRHVDSFQSLTFIFTSSNIILKRNVLRFFPPTAFTSRLSFFFSHHFKTIPSRAVCPGLRTAGFRTFPESGFQGLEGSGGVEGLEKLTGFSAPDFHILNQPMVNRNNFLGITYLVWKTKV